VNNSADVKLLQSQGHVNYMDPGLSRKHFKFAARWRVGGVEEIGCAGVYVSKCSWERPGSV